MKKTSRMPCPTCGSLTKITNLGNVDMSHWRKGKKSPKGHQHWLKQKRPSMFAMKFACKNGDCLQTGMLRGPSKALVLQAVRNQYRNRKGIK